MQSKIKYKGVIYRESNLRSEVGTLIMDFGAVYGNLHDTLNLLKNMEKRIKKLGLRQISKPTTNLKKLVALAVKIPRPLGG